MIACSGDHPWLVEALKGSDGSHGEPQAGAALTYLSLGEARAVSSWTLERDEPERVRYGIESEDGLALVDIGKQFAKRTALFQPPHAPTSPASRAITERRDPQFVGPILLFRLLNWTSSRRVWHITGSPTNWRHTRRPSNSPRGFATCSTASSDEHTR